MMHYCRHMLEKPLMGAISDEVYLIGIHSTQTRPALRNDSPNADSVHRFENGCGNSYLVLEYNAPEPNIYWRGAG
jgi:hypothetical protein